MAGVQRYGFSDIGLSFQCTSIEDREQQIIYGPLYMLDSNFRPNFDPQTVDQRKLRVINDKIYLGASVDVPESIVPGKGNHKKTLRVSELNKEFQEVGICWAESIREYFKIKAFILTLISQQGYEGTGTYIIDIVISGMQRIVFSESANTFMKNSKNYTKNWAKTLNEIESLKKVDGKKDAKYFQAMNELKNRKKSQYTEVEESKKTYLCGMVAWRKQTLTHDKTQGTTNANADFPGMNALFMISKIMQAYLKDKNNMMKRSDLELKWWMQFYDRHKRPTMTPFMFFYFQYCMITNKNLENNWFYKVYSMLSYLDSAQNTGLDLKCGVTKFEPTQETSTTRDFVSSEAKKKRLQKDKKQR